MKVPAIPGVDVEEGLTRLEGNAELYLRLLHAFPTEARSTLEQIGQALSRRDFDGARMLTHTIKGLCGNLALTELFSSAMALERPLHEHGREQSLHAFEMLRGSFSRFAQAMEALDRVAGDTAGDSAPAAASEEKSIGLSDARRLLVELRRMIIGSDPQARQFLKTLSGGFGFPQDCQRSLDALQMELDRSEFEQALRMLTHIESRLGQ